jgi:hypothetical protein
MAQATRSSRPKTACCRCRRRVDGNSRYTNLGFLCDSCYDLLQRSELGRRLYRLVYRLSRHRPRVTLERVPPIHAAREEEAVEVLAA